MKRKINIIILIILSNSFWIYPQAILTGNLYLGNPYFINPAYVGNKGFLNSHLVLRQTSASLPGSPSMYTMAVESPVYKSMSLGARVYSQSEGLFNTFSGFLDYSYKLKLSNQQFLRFGISAGFQSRQVRYSEIIAEDPSAIIDVASKSYEGFSFESGAGFVYGLNNLEFSLSVPQLFESKNINGTDFRTLVSYQLLPKNADFIFKPSVYINYNPNTPVLCDFSLTTYYKSQYFLGIAYRNSPGMIFSAGFIIKSLSLSYAIEIGMQKNSSIFNQVHEISISYSIKHKNTLKIDTADNQIFPIIAKNDSIDEKSLLEPVKDKNLTDSFVVQEKKNNRPLYVLQEAGKGVFVIKQLDTDSLQNKLEHQDYITDEDLISLDKDSVIASSLIAKMGNSKKETDYEIIDVGDGLYSIKWKNNKTPGMNNQNLSENFVDSILNNDKVIKNLNEQKQNLQKQKRDETPFYTIQLFIDEKNSNVLLDADIAMETRFETDSKGNFSYYLGKFKTYEDALTYKDKLSKYGSLKSKIIKL